MKQLTRVLHCTHKIITGTCLRRGYKTVYDGVPYEKRPILVANELFEIQTKTCIDHALSTIDILLDEDPQAHRYDIQGQVQLIRELVKLKPLVWPKQGH